MLPTPPSRDSPATGSRTIQAPLLAPLTPRDARALPQAIRRETASRPGIAARSPTRKNLQASHSAENKKTQVASTPAPAAAPARASSLRETARQSDKFRMQSADVGLPPLLDS